MRVATHKNRRTWHACHAWPARMSASAGVVARAYGPPWLGSLMSAFELSVFVALLAVYGEAQEPYPPGALVAAAFVDAAWGACCAWDAAHPNRGAADAGGGGGAGPGATGPDAKRSTPAPCACGCEERDDHCATPLALVRRPMGTASHLIGVHTGNASRWLAVRDGVERIDVFSLGLQLVGYASVLAWCSLVAFAVPPAGTAQRWLMAVAVGFTAAATLVRVPVNLKTHCAYVSGERQRKGGDGDGDTGGGGGKRARRAYACGCTATRVAVHFCVTLPEAAGVSFASVAAVSLVLDVAGLVGYTVAVVVFPFAVCALSPPVKTDAVHDDAPSGLMLVHGCEEYLYPWWGFRTAAEAAWWAWFGVASLAGGVATPPTSDAGDTARIVLSSLAATCACVYVFDVAAHGVPQLAVIVASLRAQEAKHLEIAAARDAHAYVAVD